VKDIHINVFRSRKDNCVRPLPTSWENIVGLLTSGHEVVENKEDTYLFNAVHYKTIDQIPDGSEDWYVDPITGSIYAKRKQVNIIEVDFLVLDYDDNTTIDEIKDRFQKYEYVCYSSFRHLYDDKTHKFRIIIPLTKPIPAWKKYNKHGVAIDGGEWYQIRNGLETFAGPCDPASFNPNQIYAMPSVPESRAGKSFTYHNKGKRLDWEQLESNPFQKYETDPGIPSDQGLVKTGEEYLKPDQILQTKTGTIRVSDVTGRIGNVLCPFHPDKNPSEFVRKVEKTGNIFLFCSTCNKKYYMRRDDVITSAVKPIQSEKHDDNNTNITPASVNPSGELSEHDRLSYFFGAEYADDVTYLSRFYNAEDRTRVLKQLSKIKGKINDDLGFMPQDGPPIYKSHILYMPEGAGKSRLVIDMARDGQNIIFACKSWEQVEGKYDEYLRAGIKEGFNVKVARSKDAKARRIFGTKVVRGNPSGPFSPGKILDEETIEEFIKNNPDLSPDFIRLSWQFFSPDRLSFEGIPYPDIDENGDVVGDELSTPLADADTRIILTTFEQLRIHRLRNTFIPDRWIIWFDDPDINDVIDIDPYDIDRWGELPEDRLDKETREINGRRYFTRDSDQSLGYNLRLHKCVYTTTEIITKNAIELMMRRRREEYQVHDEMDDIAGGEITILGTSKVRKKVDGIIPLFVRRLNKEKSDTRLIADGLSSEFNHSNNKGRNDLNKTNILVELSIPHPIQVRTICDALEKSYSTDRNEITRVIMLDRMHQAIGRNCGYRYKGYECVVLADKQVHKNIVENTRYRIDRDNSVQIDRTRMMGTKDTRTENAASPMVRKVEYLLNNTNNYVSDYRKIKPDIEYVMKSIKDDSKREEYIIRLLTSLSELSGVRFDTDQPNEEPESGVREKYLHIGNWILENWVPENKQDFVIRKVYEDEEKSSKKYGT
jgi:hypothetical protein